MNRLFLAKHALKLVLICSLAELFDFTGGYRIESKVVALISKIMNSSYTLGSIKYTRTALSSAPVKTQKIN